MDTWEEIQSGHSTIKIYRDEFANPMEESPREWDNLGTMVCWHRNYNLGDEHSMLTPQQALVALAESVIEPYHERVNGWYTHELWEWAAYDNIPNDKESGYPLDALQKLVDKHFIILPLYLYDHSGITMNTSGFYCPWDSGQVGYIYVSKEDVRKEWGWKYLTEKRIEKIRQILRTEVEIYDHYLTGMVFGYQVECNMCGNELDSCWGFYGDNHEKSGLLDYAKGNECPCVNRVLFRQALKEEGAGL